MQHMRIFWRAGVWKTSTSLAATTKLRVLAFDWASTHGLGPLPLAVLGLPVPGVAAGYLKDTEVRTNQSSTRLSQFPSTRLP